MSLPKKGSRKIKVENVDYLWIARGNGQQINLTIAAIATKAKILASFDYDTENKGSSAFVNPFIITPYIVRAVILYAIEKGLSPASKEMKLGNLSQKLNLDLSGSRKLKKLRRDLEKRINQDKHDPREKDLVQDILKETNHFIRHGEWFVAFEIMISNLDEINYKLEDAELALVKEIFVKAKVDWKNKWSWIDRFKI